MRENKIEYIRLLREYILIFFHYHYIIKTDKINISQLNIKITVKY